MLRDQLLANGIEDSAIELIPDEATSVARALEMAREGDLVVIFADDVRRSWGQVIQHEGDDVVTGSGEEAKQANSFVEEDPEAFSLDPGARLVRDERGVRLAREVEESD
jgi:cyanophycin synthetase